MACKEGQFDVVELMVNDQIKTFSINLNAQHVNGMTPFDLALGTIIKYFRVHKKKSKKKNFVSPFLYIFFWFPKLFKTTLHGAWEVVLLEEVEYEVRRQ